MVVEGENGGFFRGSVRTGEEAAASYRIGSIATELRHRASMA
jgi:hypothetical protein